jgi:hypothetical protein
MDPDINLNPIAKLVYGYRLRHMTKLMRVYEDDGFLSPRYICQDLAPKDGVSFVALRNGFGYEVFIGKIISLPNTNIIEGETPSADACVSALNSRLTDWIGGEDFEPFTTADLTQTGARFYLGCT